MNKQYEDYMNAMTNGEYGIQQWRLMIAKTLDTIIERLDRLERKDKG